jgi:hypothetical protein
MNLILLTHCIIDDESQARGEKNSVGEKASVGKRPKAEAQAVLAWRFLDTSAGCGKPFRGS